MEKLFISLFLIFSCALFQIQAKQDFLIISESSPAFYIKKKQKGPWVFFPFEQYDLNKNPWVDQDKLKQAYNRFQKFVKIQKKAGYNGIVLGDLARAVTWEKLNIFPKNSKEYKKAKIYQAFFRSIIKDFPEINFFIPADFQLAHPSIKRYTGNYNYKNPKLKKINQTAIEEIFLEIPQIKGLILRTGEGGKVYSQQNYGSAMIYINPQRIRRVWDFY